MNYSIKKTQENARLWHATRDDSGAWVCGSRGCPCPFLSPRAPGVPNQPRGRQGMLSPLARPPRHRGTHEALGRLPCSSSRSAGVPLVGSRLAGASGGARCRLVFRAFLFPRKNETK